MREGWPLVITHSLNLSLTVVIALIDFIVIVCVVICLSIEICLSDQGRPSHYRVLRTLTFFEFKYGSNLKFCLGLE